MAEIDSGWLVELFLSSTILSPVNRTTPCVVLFDEMNETYTSVLPFRIVAALILALLFYRKTMNSGEDKIMNVMLRLHLQAVDTELS